MAPVLVAYATKYGSTQEVADALATALREHGVDTDVHPACDVTDLSAYSAVILGGSLYYSRWHRDARRFLRRFRETLLQLPMAVFALGPFNDKPEDFEGARKQLTRALAKTRQLSPVSVQIFGGRLDPTRLRFPHSTLKMLPESDIRDWSAIQAWADTLLEALNLR